MRAGVLTMRHWACVARERDAMFKKKHRVLHALRTKKKLTCIGNQIKTYPLRSPLKSNGACSWHNLQCRPAAVSVGPSTMHAHHGHLPFSILFRIQGPADPRKALVVEVTSSVTGCAVEARTLSPAASGLNVVVVGSSSDPVT